MATPRTPFIKLNKSSKPSDAAQYLCTLPAIRERCSKIFEIGRKGELDHFRWNEKKEKDVVEYCAKIIERDFGKDYSAIPPHGRRNHFATTNPTIDRIQLVTSLPAFPSDPLLSTKALLDLYMISVLLDAGAGSSWTYTECNNQGEPTGFKGGRSEGLAVASYAMFVNGAFSYDPAEEPFRVDADALIKLSLEQMTKGLQVSNDNQMEGLEGRCNLLVNLGHALKGQQNVFATGRPGDMLNYLSKQGSSDSETEKQTVIPIGNLWAVLISLLSAVWPPRLKLEGQPLGDVWTCNALTKAIQSEGAARTPGDDLVPFHKLSQWLCYSLIQPIEHVAGWKVEGWERDMTGLPEYRNGGLLVDLGVLELRGLTNADYPNSLSGLPKLKPDHPAIIEWRAMTVISLDRIADKLRAHLGIEDPSKLTLAQVLEAATWKGGREIAMAKRGKTGGGPPIEIDSDGTVF